MNTVYYYDGTFDGLMCCVFESVYKREIPVAIELDYSEKVVIFQTKHIKTDIQKANRVKKSIPIKISLEIKEIVEQAFLSCLEDKEIKILEVLLLGFKMGKDIRDNMEIEPVVELKQAVVKLAREVHYYTNYMKFQQQGEKLVASITPKNNVLPLVHNYFCRKFCSEEFMIYDKTHNIALIYKDGQSSYISTNNLILSECST